MITREQAQTLLKWAHEQNPGPWLGHSQTAARAAETIAKACGMDDEKAYLMGLMHDIGRYEGVRGMHHAIAGYALMMEKGEEELARICLTHSFQLPTLEIYTGPADCTPEEKAFMQELLDTVVLDEYDRLIQLCDAISLPNGVSTMEARLFEGHLRHGFNAYTQRKWQAFLDIKKAFDEQAGMNIYRLFKDEISSGIFG